MTIKKRTKILSLAAKTPKSKFKKKAKKIKVKVNIPKVNPEKKSKRSPKNKALDNTLLKS